MTSAFVVEVRREGAWVVVARYATYVEAGTHIREQRGNGEKIRCRLVTSW